MNHRGSRRTFVAALVSVGAAVACGIGRASGQRRIDDGFRAPNLVERGPNSARSDPAYTFDETGRLLSATETEPRITMTFGYNGA